MADKAFKEKLAAFKKNEEAGKKRAGEFGQGLPVGNYLGQLQALTAGKSQTSNRLQVHRELLVVDDGEHANEVSHDWMNLEHEVGIAITTRFIEAHGYEMPEIVDAERSEEEGDLVFHQDFLDVLQAIVDAAPTYRFRIRQSGEFKNVDVLEITERGGLDDEPGTATDDETIGKGEVEGEVEGEDEETEETPAEEPVDEVRDKAVEFCLAVGIEVEESDDMDDIRAKVNGCVFPAEGVTTAQLKADGFDEDDNIRYDAEQIALLEEIGCGEAIVLAKKAAAPAKKTAPAKKAAPVKKAAPKKKSK